jgi:predicted HD phosphohydrolase
VGIMTIQCPRTGQRVSTGIETDRASFEAMPIVNSTMRCWVCGAEHVWSKRWATFVDDAYEEERLQPLHAALRN